MVKPDVVVGNLDDNKPQFSRDYVLSMAQILVQGYENIELVRLDQSQQLPIGSATPTHIKDRSYVMIWEGDSYAWIDAFV